MGKKSEIHLYVDGATIEGKNSFGLGWSWPKGKGHATKGEKLRVKVPRDKPEIAHIYAAARGLESLANGSKVIVHSVDPTLCRIIQRNMVTVAIGKTKGTPELRKAWRALEKAIANHSDVTAEHSANHDERLMSLAHKHALAAAGKPFNENGRKPRQEEARTATMMAEILDEDGLEDRFPKFDEVA